MEKFIILIPLFLLWITSMLHGASNAISYSGKADNAFPGNEHSLYVIERGLWLLLIWSGFYLELKDIFFLTLAHICMFSFFHNGAYQITKFRILFPRSSYLYSLKEFTASSKTDKSKVHFDFTSRLVAFLFGAVIITIGIISK